MIMIMITNLLLLYRFIYSVIKRYCRNTRAFICSTRVIFSKFQHDSRLLEFGCWTSAISETQKFGHSHLYSHTRGKCWKQEIISHLLSYVCSCPPEGSGLRALSGTWCKDSLHVRALSHSRGTSVNALSRSKQCPQSASCGVKTHWTSAYISNW